MKDKIIHLRNEGKSYSEIQKELGCSKGSISYHCGDGQKEKYKQRLKSSRKHLHAILKRKKDNFSIFRGKRFVKGKRESLTFSSKEFIHKLESNPFCYLTGRKIDLWQPKTYQCDHIMPLSRGGNSNLDNLGLTCKEANMAKSGMTKEEFLLLCQEVLLYNGYTVIKNG